MRLLKALMGSVGGTLADQWKEYFYCDSMPEDVLAVKGKKRVSGRSANRENDNIITNGSVIAVADGQAMMIVDQGKVVEFTAEPGEFTYDASSEPTIFCGDLGTGIMETFKTVGKRFTFGGEKAKDQRVYYFNLKELVGSKYGTPSPVPFRVVDRNIGLDWEISVRCFGEYSFHICDPLLFYTNVCGNITEDYTRDRLEGQMKTELLTALQPAFARISEMGIRYSSLPAHTMELADILNQVLSKKWRELRGVEIVSFGVSSIKASEEDEKMLKDMQRTAVFSNPNMAAAYDVMARGDAMKAAASNTAGAATGFMGMGMVQNMGGGTNAAQLFQMGQQQAAQQAAAPASAPAPAAESWKCSCGATATGKFCTECGAKRPEAPAGWTCSCGTVNQGKFCTECGAKKPSAAPQYRCNKCGWVPADPKNPPRFCPECGDPFGAEDVVG